jgi:hypothetical protein
MHLAFHVPFRTITMSYISIKMHVALPMVYVLLKMCPASIMACNIVKMWLAFHVPFESLTIVYVFVKMHLTLTMTYILLETHLASIMAYILARMCLGVIMVTRTTTSVTSV